MKKVYKMALNLNIPSSEKISEMNAAEEAKIVEGSPEEFAKGNEQEGVQVASAFGYLKNLTKLFGTKTPPTPMKETLPEFQNNPNYSYRKTQKEATEDFVEKGLLSKEGAEKFEKENFSAELSSEDLRKDSQIKEAQSILSEDEQSAKDLLDKGKGAATFTQNPKAKAFKNKFASEEDADKFINLKSNAEDFVTEKSDFNFSNIKSTDDVLETIDTISNLYKKEKTPLTRGVIPNERTMQDSAELLLDEIGLTKRIINRKTGELFNAAELTAARQLLTSSAKKLSDLANLVDEGTATNKEQLLFRRQLAIHSAIQLQLKGAQTEAARALQSFNINVGEMSELNAAMEISRALDENGSVATTQALAKKVKQINRIQVPKHRNKSLNNFAVVGYGSKTKKIVHEMYVAGLLWQTATQFKNTVGTASFMLFQLPAEQIAGLYGSVARGGKKLIGASNRISEDQVYTADAAIRFWGQMSAFQDSAKLFARSFATEMPSSRINRYDIEDFSAISSTDKGIFGTAINWFGISTRLPFRLLTSTDEFFRNMSQRGELYVAAHRRYQYSINQGKSKSEAADEASKIFLDPRAVGDLLEETGRKDVMMSDLGTTGKVIRKFQDNWFGRFILPFSQAPTNSIISTADFIPGNPFGRSFYDVLGKNGPKKQQIALGKYSFGAGFGAYVYTNALNGKITGGMPRDKNVRESLSPGWQPYSFVFRSNVDEWEKDENGILAPLYDQYGRPNGPLTYISYHGFEPVGGVIGIFADAAQTIVRTHDSQERTQIIQQFILSSMRYYRDLPMLQAVGDIINVLDSDDIDVRKLLRSPAEASADGMLPFSGFLRMYNRLNDPIKKRTAGSGELYTMDEIRNAKDSEGNFLYRTKEGDPDFSLVGKAKNNTTSEINNTLKLLQQYNAKNSQFFTSEETKEKLLVPIYDSFGEKLGADEASLATSPGVALWNNITGFKIKKGEVPSKLKSEIIRLIHTTQGELPIRQPAPTKSGIRLTNKQYADWINISKNEIKLRYLGRNLTFREHLEETIRSLEYNARTTSDRMRVKLLRNVENKYLENGFEQLLDQLDENGNFKYGNLREAYEDLQTLKEQGRR